MIQAVNPELDLTMSRLIKAPRAAVWRAWTDRASFEQWWIPAPAKCKVLHMDLSPGGAFVTADERGRRRFPAASECLLPRRRRGRADRLHQCADRRMAACRAALHDGDHHAAATIRRAPTTPPMSCTRTTPTGTCMTSWASRTAGAPSRDSSPSWWSPKGKSPAFRRGPLAAANARGGSHYINLSRACSARAAPMAVFTSFCSSGGGSTAFMPREAIHNSRHQPLL